MCVRSIALCPRQFQTNQRAELWALVLALRNSRDRRTLIASDSRLVVDGTALWLDGWARGVVLGRQPPANWDLWLAVLAQRTRACTHCTLTGLMGNDRPTVASPRR